MNEIYPVVTSGDQMIIINSGDKNSFDGSKLSEIKCIVVDFKNRKINPISNINEHLGSGAWNRCSELEGNMFLQILNTKFSDQDILEQIIKPLATNLAAQ